MMRRRLAGLASRSAWPGGATIGEQQRYEWRLPLSAAAGLCVLLCFVVNLSARKHMATLFMR